MAYKEPGVNGTANQVTSTGTTAGYQLALTSNIYVGGISFDSGVNSLQNYVQSGTFVPTAFGDSTPGTPVYTSQLGWYTRFGYVCYIKIAIGYSSISGGAAGSLTLGGLPFAQASVGNINIANLCALSDSVTYGGGKTLVLGAHGNNTTSTFQVVGSVSGAGVGFIAIPASGTLYISGHYLITGA